MSRAHIFSSWTEYEVMETPFLMFQIWSDPSDPVEASWSPWLNHMTLRTGKLWPSSVLRHCPLPTFQILIVLSALAEASTLSKGENEMSQITQLWPFKTWISYKSEAFQILIVLSWDAVATTLFESPGETHTTLITFSWAI